MLRVLHIANARMGSGGTETFLMNMYRNMDRDKIQFDFVVFSEEVGMYEEEIKKMGGNIYKVSRKQDGLIKSMKQIYQIVKQNKYEIVHRHCGSAIMFFDFLASKIGGAKHLIAHAQNAGDIHSRLHYICRPFLNLLVKNRFACSKSTGEWMFGRAKFEVLPSVIDIGIYKFDIYLREQIRREMGITDKFVIGNIAVFRAEKNHMFMLKVFRLVVEKDTNAVLLLVGDGELFGQVKEQVEQLGITDNVIFTGQRKDIEKLYNAMDVFFLPSLYEGFPMTLIEAQSEGLPCIVSDRITKEVSIVEGLVSYVSVEEEIDACVEAILTIRDQYINQKFIREDCTEKVEKAGFSAKVTANRIKKMYIEMD